MLVACRLAGCPRLAHTMQASTRSRNKPLRRGLVTDQDSDGGRWTTISVAGDRDNHGRTLGALTGSL